MYTYTGAMEQQGDLESHGLLSSQPSQRERTCGWQCAAAAFLLGLVLMVTLLVRGGGSLTADVASKVQLQDDSVWKEVLGHEAYEEYKKTLSEKPSTTEQTEQTEQTTEKATTTFSSTLPSTTVSKSSQTEAPQPGLIVSHTSPSTSAGLIFSAKTTTEKHTTTEKQTTAEKQTTTEKDITTEKHTTPALIVSPSTTESPTSASDKITKLGNVAKEFMDEAAKLDPKSAQHHSLTNVAHFLTDVAQAKKRQATTTPRLNLPQLTGNISQMPLHSALAPLESLNDGNKCASDEEEMLGTCYKKCVDLTGGYYPVRTSPFSCCKAEPCSFHNTRVHMSFCSGFDVAGDQEGHGCPNFEGACLTDEELFNGLCYKKCSLFADGATYNHRVAPNMCCSTKGFACMFPKYFKFSPDFAVGGGIHDGNAQTPSYPHAPMKELTEVNA